MPDIYLQNADIEAATAFSDNWKFDIYTIVSQQEQQRYTELMKACSYRRRKVIIHEEVYDRLV